MGLENSLVLMSRASQMLAEATTIQKAKELMDLALTAADWAKRKGVGDEVIQYAKGYAFEAERRMGALLKATERNPGAQPSKKDGGTMEEPPSNIPTLKDLGITKGKSSQAQFLADLPEGKFEEIKSGKKTVAKIKKESKQEKEKQDLAAAQKKITAEARKHLESISELRVCSCKELFESGIKPDVVITDPPYSKEFLPLFSELAQACKDVPLVAVMSGQSYLPEVLKRLCQHLEYGWILAYLTPGGQSIQQWPVKVNSFWKPILIFGKSEEWFGDVAKSKLNDNDKRFHGWGQSESGMMDIVERLTKPGQLVCDPFLGGGTTAVVSFALGRRFIGCDIDSKSIDTTKQRLEGNLLCKK